MNRVDKACVQSGSVETKWYKILNDVIKYETVSECNVIHNYTGKYHSRASKTTGFAKLLSSA